MALILAEAISRVPQWAGAHEIKTSPLGGGITNRNFRVDVDGESFVLRIGGEKTELLGIDRRKWPARGDRLSCQQRPRARQARQDEREAHTNDVPKEPAK